MPLSRTNRIDRRRRVLLDAVAADSEFAVESVRAKKRLRSRDSSLDAPDDAPYTQKYRDPGYSQAVRKTCQHRMVQLIPVRRGTLSIVLSCMWMLWGALLFAHYWIFTRLDVSALTETERAASFAASPIAQLFHLRSSHSIAQWLTTQLWMLTAVTAWMIFHLRRHKLDDYRARYRIWVVLAIAAAISSFEASSSGLLLLGLSIDSWAQREIGYAGWPLVLATYASIIGVIGIRLCGELKSAPMSVVSWLFGLIAWGLAALLGTGLLKITWSSTTVDLVVGGCLLGGILAVFQASGIYLRQTYIHAQKRFLVRNGANLAPIQWKVPKLSLRRKPLQDRPIKQMDEPESGSRSKWKMPWPRKRGNSLDVSAIDRDRETPNKRETLTADRSSSDRATDSGLRSAERSTERTSERSSEKSPKPTGRLFGFIPSRHEQNEKLETEPIGEDGGPMVDRGLTKKRGWFGIGGNRDAESRSPAGTEAPAAKPTRAATREHDGDKPVVAAKSEKRRFWSRGSSELKEQPKTKIESPQSDAPKAKRGWVSKFSKSYQQDSLNSAEAQASKSSGTSSSASSSASAKQYAAKDNTDLESEVNSRKKSWLSSFVSKKPKGPRIPKQVKAVDKKPDAAQPNDPTAKSARRGLFGMLDGLKLKPPTDESARKDNAKAVEAHATKPVPIKQGQQIPSTQSNSDDDADDDDSGRPMSKADRKRLRRQNQDDRRAA